MVFGNYEYFVVIVQSGSLTRAAEKLYVSQPSLSQYIKRLETRLGVELFDRSASPLRLTYAGERYYLYARQLMQMDRDVQRELQDIKSEVSGRLRLGVALWRGACLLPDVFPVFHRRYPQIRVELFEGSAAQMETELRNDRLDLAVMNLPRTLDYGKLCCDIICEERILLAAPARHPRVEALLREGAAGDYPVAPLELVQDLPLIMTKPGQNLTLEVSHALGKHHIESEVLLETANLTTAINLVREGVACTFVPEEGAKVNPYPGEVAYFALDCPDLVWDLAAVYRKGASLPRLAQLFLRTMREELMQ